jgi:hypothetical protein
MWKPIDKELEQQLASEVAQIVKAVCPHAVVTYTTCKGYPLDIDLMLEVYNVSESEEECLKVALRPFRRDARQRLRGLLGILYRSEPPPEGAKFADVEEKSPSKVSVVLSLTEGGYVYRWYEPWRWNTPQGRLQKPTSPETDRTQVVIGAQPIYLHRIGKKQYLVPVVSETPQKFLRPTRSLSLGPHSYLFAGEIIACDHYRIRYGGHSKDEEAVEVWRTNCIVDCGIPLHFNFGPEYWCQEVPHFKAKEAERGVYIAGLVKLSERFEIGLHQPVSGIIRRMHVLGMSPDDEYFGMAREVPYGYRLPLDPDTISQQFVFMTLEVTEVGQLTYQPIPARLPDCPEPDLNREVDFHV